MVYGGIGTRIYHNIIILRIIYYTAMTKMTIVIYYAPSVQRVKRKSNIFPTYLIPT